MEHATAFGPIGCTRCASTAELVRVTGRAWACPGCGDELAPAPAPDLVLSHAEKFLGPKDAFQGPWHPEPPPAPLPGLRRPSWPPGASRGPRLVVCPGELDPQAPATGLDRAAREAARPAAEDPELVRVRALVFALRPDAPDPLQPPPVERTETPAPYLRTGDGAPPWDRLPRGLGSGPLAAADPGTDRREHVLAAIASLPPDAAAVCRWLRTSATFAQGLRGLYVDVGLAFASEDQRTAWVDLTARRLGAASHGRALVLAAERAWREAP